MCGIAGEHRRDGATPSIDTLTTMADAMVHRGPDDSGFHNAAGIGFGFRRLSIIDVEGGHQPMSNGDRRIWVQLNGEIYNYRSLRSELIASGYVFVTDSDAEVLAHGYEEWGVDLIDRLNGMFAVAIWDDRSGTLVLARDHLGVKPLYYSDNGRRLLFGSEMRALLATGTVDAVEDVDALRLLLHFGYIPAPHTLVAGVSKLRPGHLLISNSAGCRVHRYWNPVPDHDARISAGDAADKYAELVRRSVRAQLMSDVPVGALLSAGVDSAMVLAAAREATTDPIATFTVGFGQGFEYDEAAEAAGTAAMFDADHHAITLGVDDFNGVLAHSLAHLEEPVLSQSTFAYDLLCREAARHVKVVLTGQGADEPWAGYDRYLGERYGGFARTLFRSTAVRSVGERVPALHRLRRATDALGEPDPVQRFAAIHQVFAPDTVNRIARGGLAASTASATDVIKYWQRPVEHLDPFSQLLYVDTRLSLADDLLFYGDKLSMANSLEARVPLLDRGIVDFVETLPPSMKLRGRTGKVVHKRAARSLVPGSIVDRTKRGFATPVDAWFAGTLSVLLDDTVLAPDSFCSRHLDLVALRELVEEHRSGRRNHRRELTVLLSYELIARRLFGGAMPERIANLEHGATS